jgi:hypothetical protein
VHAHHGSGLGGRRPVDLFEVDEGLAAMRATFHARLDARFAADATALVDHEHR